MSTDCWILSQGTFQVTQFYVNRLLDFESGDVSSDSFLGFR